MSRVNGIIATGHDAGLCLASLRTSALDGPGVPLTLGHDGVKVGSVLRTWRGVVDGQPALIGELDIADESIAREVSLGKPVGLSIGAYAPRDRQTDEVLRDASLHHVAIVLAPKNPHCVIEGNPPMVDMNAFAAECLPAVVRSAMYGEPIPDSVARAAGGRAEAAEIASHAFLEATRMAHLDGKDWRTAPPSWVARVAPWDGLTAAQSAELVGWLGGELQSHLKATTMEAVAEVVRGMKRSAPRPPAHRPDWEELDTGWVHSI